MKPDTKVSIITYAGIAAILLVLGGVAVFFSTRPAPPSDLSECSTEPHSLISPTTPALVLHALSVLEEAGAIPSIESGVESLVASNWVMNPDDNYDIEYWLIFQSGDRRTAAELNIICTELSGQLNLEYGGSREVD